MADESDWRSRLRAAVDRTGKKHGYIAEEAGIARGTLSRILNGNMNPSFATVVRIAYACGVTLGWIVDERPHALTAEERANIQQAASTLEVLLRE